MAGQREASEAPLIVAYIVLAFLGQATIVVALLQSNLLPAWIGWTSVILSLSLLVILLGFTPGDHYYPVARDFMPLLIGIPLLWKG